MNVFERSLIRMGDGGFTITIPKPWVTFYQLQPGDVVRVKTNKKLVVEPVVLGRWRRKRINTMPRQSI